MPAAKSVPPAAVSRPSVRRIGQPRAALTVTALGVASMAAVSMVVARGFYTGHHFGFQFLLWNLLLAWVPVVAALAAYRFHVRGRRPDLLSGVCALVWFLFFPNALYIVTDFVHLEHRPPVPLWFDLLLIASFAWTGLCLGYLSLYLMQEVVRARFGRGTGWGFAVGMLALGSVGVYAGRVLRWNSWDVIRHPTSLLRQGIDLADGPSGRLGVVAFVSVLFLFLLTTYCATFALTNLHEDA